MVSTLHGNSNQTNRNAFDHDWVNKQTTIFSNSFGSDGQYFQTIFLFELNAGSFWYSTKKTLGLAGKPLDAAAEIHRIGFQHLVRNVKDSFRADNYMVTATVLPNVNTTLHYDVANIIPYVDFVTLAAYDYQTWERNPYEADYPAPTYSLEGRVPQSNIDYQVTMWLQMGAPDYKLVVGIPTHGRSWKLTKDSTRTGVPPIHEVSAQRI